jgi:hypothetical protein
MNDTDLTHPAPPAPNRQHISLRKLSRPATKIFMMLVDGLVVGDAKKLDNAPGSFMAVSVDCLSGDRMPLGGTRGESLYAIAHNYEANGDLVPDPDVEFYVVDDPTQPGSRAIYPTAIDHGPLGYYRYVHFDSAGQPDGVSKRGQADLASFCDIWMKNIAIQQGLVLL